MKSENRHFTQKWKKRRKNHDGDKCDNADCSICAAHKLLGNSSKRDRKQEKIAKEKLKFDLKNL